MPTELEGKFYTVYEGDAATLLGAVPGEYPVMVGDWGWDDGDLYIMAPSKFKLRDLKRMESK